MEQMVPERKTSVDKKGGVQKATIRIFAAVVSTAKEEIVEGI